MLAQLQLQEFEGRVEEKRVTLRLQQQTTLQDAGVPGFFPTNEPQSIALQSDILNILVGICKSPLFLPART